MNTDEQTKEYQKRKYRQLWEQKEMNLDKINVVRDSITNGQRDQAREQIRAYGVRQFFQDLSDLDYLTPDEFQSIWLMYNKNPYD